MPITLLATIKGGRSLESWVKMKIQKESLWSIRVVIQRFFLNFFFLFYTLIVRGRDETKILCLGGDSMNKKKITS